MSLASDLMGIGVPPLQAERTASAGVGPIAATAAANATATGAYQIKNAQYITYFTTTGSANSCVLPVPGGDTGPLVGDDFTVHCATATSLNLYTPAGVTLNVVGSVVTSTNAQVIAQYHTLSVWVYNSVTYFGTYT